jgi:hypothetical protein
MIVKGASADAEIALVQAVEGDEPGLASFAYLRLADDDFERLSYALSKRSAPMGVERTWDDAALMVRGADAGRDVLLTSHGSPVAVVQCKRLESGMVLPAVFREIAKLILFAKINGDLSFDRALLYMLTLARDPASTVVEFFARRQELEADRENDIRAAAREVRESYATLASLTPDEAESEVIKVLPKLSLRLVRPTDLDEWMGREPSVSARFFRQRIVVDSTKVVAGQQEIMALLQTMADKVDGVPLLTDADLRILKERIEQTPESHRLSVGIAMLFGYPKEMFALNGDLRSRIGRLAAVLREIDQDYIDWIFKRSREMAEEICNTGEVLFGVPPFARQIPTAFLGLVAKECAAAAISGTVMSQIVANITKEPAFRDDSERMANVRDQLLEAGLRYLAGDFSQLVGDPELVSTKRYIIAKMMVGLTSRADWSRRSIPASACCSRSSTRRRQKCGPSMRTRRASFWQVRAGSMMKRQCSGWLTPCER